jgi:hypothetical protein
MSTTYEGILRQLNALDDIKSILRYEIPENARKVVPESIGKSVIPKRPPYRYPSSYTISVLTLLGDLGINITINRSAFYHCIKANLYYDACELNTNCEGGESESGENKSNNSEPRILDIKNNVLTNGCELQMSCGETNNIKLKLFNNGVVHLTGIKSVEDAEECVGLVCERIKYLMKLSKVHIQILNFCSSGIPTLVCQQQSSIEYIQNHKNCDVSASIGCESSSLTFFVKFFGTKGIFTNLMKFFSQLDVRSLSLSCKTFNRFFHHTNDKLWKFMLDNTVFDGENKRLSYIYRKSRYNVYDIGNGTVRFVKTLKSVDLKSRYFKMMQSYKPIAFSYNPSSDNPVFSNTKIEMINSNFSVGFHMNHKKMAKLIQIDYPYMNISYDPDDKYHGVKIYWPHPDTIQSNGDSNDTVYIFISVFRTGSVLMSGAKTTDQLDDAYSFINSLLEKYYSRIWIPGDS